MTLTLYTGPCTNELAVVADTASKREQKQRILAAIGNERGSLPLVDDETLARYFVYLSENLYLPFNAHYTEPTSLFSSWWECEISAVLDPSKYLSDPFDGILCKVRKAGFEINLPLLELDVSPDNPNFQILQDYGYWFWNWRCR